MRVHDEMGRCLIAAQKYLQEERIDSIPDDVPLSWKRAVSMVKYNNDIPDEDMLSQIRKACESVKIDFVQTGELPEKKSDAYVFTCAIRECVTNAVRYAEAKALYAAFDETADESVLTVTNDGKIPEKEITEGGGLSTLRRRIERAGGQMQIQSKPYFKLTVTIPKEKEEVL
jgi:signal transduction histidine kinase